MRRMTVYEIPSPRCAKRRTTQAAADLLFFGTVGYSLRAIRHCAPLLTELRSLRHHQRI